MFQFVSKSIAMPSLTLTINDLFLNHRQSLIQTIYRIVGCPQTAEDLAHEAYLKMVHATFNDSMQPIDENTLNVTVGANAPTVTC